MGVIYGLEIARALAENPDTAHLAVDADSKKKRPFGQVGPVSWDGEIIASGARDAGTRGRG
jgi:N-carbamoyl-L-amino-acid hydrolase